MAPVLTTARPFMRIVLEEIECYSYGIVAVGTLYTLFRFSMGLDNWVITLDDPYPSPAIRAADLRTLCGASRTRRAAGGSCQSVGPPSTEPP